MPLLSNSGSTLAIATLAAIVVIAITQALTLKPITRAKDQWNLEQLEAVLPSGKFDIDLLDSIRYRTISYQGKSEKLAVHTIKEGDQPTAFVLEILTPYGYSGDIRLLLGIKRDGTITGVRVVEHRETPGLGDDIDHRKSDWITAFEGQSLAMSSANWKIKKDGGQFDSFTGATITPRAVVNAIHQALIWYEKHSEWMIE